MNILVVEDEKKLQSFLSQGFVAAGYNCQTADSAEEAEKSFQQVKPDLVVLDVMLPQKSGLELLKQWRAQGHDSHVILLTALNTTTDKIVGLDAGADDYLSKPFEFEELLARVRALLRRKSDEKPILKNGDLSMDLIHRTVTRAGQAIELTSKEFSLLELFMRHTDKVIDRMMISKQVWGTEFDPDSNVIDVYVNHLRKKIDAPFEKKILRTVVGQGYVLAKVPEIH